ncbi:MAG: hypothetical protein KGK08_14835 [Acidobacteriota bacterium]|nr:hypothetical protein [Acidobacteriota bacterium]
MATTTTTRLLRLTSVVAGVHGVMHTIGGVFGHAAPGPQQLAVAAMQSNRFVAMGVSRTYWDYYFGYGLFVSAYFALVTVLLWQMSNIARTHAALLRPLLLTLAAIFVLTACIAGRYFFAGPMAMELVMAALLLAAWWKAEPASAA